MNEAPANSLGLAEPKPPGAGWPAGPERSEGWSRNRWLGVIALVFAAHVAMVFLFGEKKPIVPRAVINAPTLTLANASDELLALRIRTHELKPLFLKHEMMIVDIHVALALAVTGGDSVLSLVGWFGLACAIGSVMLILR